MLAKAVASMNHCTFFNCSTASLISKWRGESEKLIHCLFDYAQLAAPSILFLDEIDALLSSRSGTNSSNSSSNGNDGSGSNGTGGNGGNGNEHESSRRMKTEFLSRMDGILSGSTGSKGVGGKTTKCVMVLATTNCPWDLDMAILRRLEKRIYVPLPDLETRKQLFLSYLQPMLSTAAGNPTTENETENEGEQKNYREVQALDVDHFATETDGYSSADIFIVCKDAAMMPMRRLIASNSMQQLQMQRAQGTLALPQVMSILVYSSIFLLVMLLLVVEKGCR
jgi:katanin p60 ATPase-containing subunit A1